MKSLLKIILVFTLLSVTSELFAQTIQMTPAFTLMYKDRTSPHTYQLFCYIENAQGVISPSSYPWVIMGSQVTFPMGQSTYYPGPVSPINVTETNPPQVNGYRIVVLVLRNDNVVRRGFSDWCGKLEIESGTINIDVESFEY